MANLRFNCGEFKPGKKRIFIDKPPPPGGGGDLPPAPIKKCCTKVPKDIVPPGDEDWTCICETPCVNSPFQCASAGARKCIPVSQLRGGQLHGRFFPNQATCEDQSFGEAPCYLCSVDCQEISAQTCPPPHEDRLRYIRKECRYQEPARDRLGKYSTIAQCIAAGCRDEFFECPPLPPITIGGDRLPPAPITQPPGEARWKCEETKIYCSDGVSTRQIKRECKLCMKNKDGTWPPGCIYKSISNCREKCKDEDLICPPITGGGRGIDPPVTPPPPPPVRGRIVPPPITQRPKWRCIVTGTKYCDDGITQIELRACSECIPDLEGRVDPDCIYDSESKCKEKCKDDVCPVEPPDEPRGDGGDGGGIQSNGNNKRKVIDISKAALLNSNQRKEQIYHPYYNLLDYPLSEELVLVENSYYRNIFSNRVAKEICYILRINGSEAAWKEFPYTQITAEKIRESLITSLKEAFQNIHFRDGSLIPEEAFLEMVWRLLATNKLDDLDPSYYINLARDQSNDEIIEFIGSSDKQTQLQAALGIIADEAVSTDPEKLQDFQRLQLRRARFLNEDINTTIPVSLFEGVSEPLPLGNEGLEVIVFNEGTALLDEAEEVIHVDLGEGDGYYLEARLENGSLAPLRTQNDLSSAFYTSVETHQQSLKLMGENSDISFYVTAINNQSEFDDNYGTPPTEPMYFKLNLGSIGDLDRRDSLVDSVSGTYSRVTGINNINAHARSYGFGAAKLNIDYDDPFITYAKETNLIGFKQNFVSFRSFAPAKSSTRDQTLVRTMPFILIVTPGKGSKHNPFATRSVLSEFNTEVSRELKTVPSIAISKNREPEHPLDIEFTANELGTFYVGLVGKENPDTQNILYKFNITSPKYQGRYFYNGKYNNSSPDIVSTPITRLVIWELITRKLFEKYTVNGLTTWDIFRRLTAEQMAAISFEFTDRFQTSLRNGFRGITIRNVLNRLDVSETGIIDSAPVKYLRLETGKEEFLLLEDETFVELNFNVDAEDKVYIQVKDRVNAKSY